MNVLIVKLTSMGDLVHTLPAITDAVGHVPDIHFDWIVDESFADIPALHPRIEQLFKTAHRRWKKQLFHTFMSGELLTLFRTLRQKKYDIVIDAQNNLKSAVITGLAKGVRCGMDKNSVREKGASWVCDRTFAIPVHQHAIDRQRQLFAKVLGYPVPNTPPDFGISTEQLPKLSIDIPKPYLVFIHSTTWDTKHWPETYWEQLIALATAAGYHVVLPWGNAIEQARATRLSKVNAHTTVLPRLSIREQASMILGSAGAVCVDTGLGHLTAALNVPAVHLYGPTDPALIGATGHHQAHLVAESGSLSDLHPQTVWDAMRAQLKS
jgi:heptosyltransferase-1